MRVAPYVRELVFIVIALGCCRADEPRCPLDSPCPSPVRTNPDEIPDPRLRAFAPRLGNITSGSHIAFGAAYQWQAPGTLPLDLEVSGLYSVRNYWTAGARIGRLRTRRETFLLHSFGRHNASEFNESRYKEPGFAAYADFNYFYFPTQRFYGFGPDSRRPDVSDYLLRTASYEAVGGYQMTDWLGVSVRAGILEFDLDPGREDQYTNTQTLFPGLPGLDRQPDFYRVTSAVLADYRDFPGDPKSGGMAGFLFSRYREKDGHQYEFNRYAVDVRHYLPLDPLLSVVALRFFSSVDDPVGQGQIPFFLNEWLGGSSTLRGFKRQRFRDRNLLLLNGEFRTEVADSVELALFYDTGKVFSDLDDYNFKRLEKGYGAGVRLKGGANLFLRFDVGHSREGTQFHASIGPAF